jgi:hypothetical protein
MTTAPLRLQLELERAGDPIRGRLHREHGEPVPFTGWLELIAAVEAARAPAPDRTPDKPESRPDRGSRDDRPSAP